MNDFQDKTSYMDNLLDMTAEQMEFALEDFTEEMRNNLSNVLFFFYHTICR
ncbi:MAG: hypothetical protein RR348_05775 [Clostridia bacterium]